MYVWIGGSCPITDLSLVGPTISNSRIQRHHLLMRPIIFLCSRPIPIHTPYLISFFYSKLMHINRLWYTKSESIQLLKVVCLNLSLSLIKPFGMIKWSFNIYTIIYMIFCFFITKKHAANHIRIVCIETKYMYIEMMANKEKKKWGYF